MNGFDQSRTTFIAGIGKFGEDMLSLFADVIWEYNKIVI